MSPLSAAEPVAPAPPLGQLTIRNVGIVYLLNGTARLVGILALLVLARLLVPHDFGLVALSGLIISILALFKDFGLGAALIQLERDAYLAADTAFWGTLFMRLVLYAALVGSAPFVASFFQEPALTYIIPVAGLGLVLEGFAAIHATIMMKKLDFRRLSLIEGVNIVFGSAVSIILAFAGFSFWSLVLGSLAIMPLSVWLYWRLEPWRPSFRFDRDQLRRLLEYGKHIVFINSGGFATKNMDNFVVGKIFGAAALGAYSLAFKFGLFSQTTLSVPVSRVLFPTYARIQNEAERVRQAYLRTLFPISLVAFPVCVATLVLPDLIVLHLLGAGWKAAVEPLRILGMYGLAASVAGPSWNVFLALGRPNVGSYTVIIELVIMGILILPGALYAGLSGVAFAVTIAITAGSVYQLVRANQLLAVPPERVAGIIGPAVIGSALMGAVLLWIRPLIGSSTYGFAILVVLAALSYMIVTQMISAGRLMRQVAEIVRALRKQPM